MELKDITRPLAVIKMEEFPFEFTLENIAKFDNDGSGAVFIRLTNEHGEWKDLVVVYDEFKRWMKLYHRNVIAYKEEGYTDVKVFYSTYENVFGHEKSGFDGIRNYFTFLKCAFEVLRGVEKRIHHCNTDIDVLYYDPYEGYHVFSIVDDEYSMYDGDPDEVIEMVEREIRSV